MHRCAATIAGGGATTSPTPTTAAIISQTRSLNRYSYVQNDPVNFTDPSGLNAEEIEGVYTWAPRWEMNLMYWRYLTFTPDSGGGGRGDDLGGGGGSDEPKKSDVQPDKLTSNEDVMKQFYCLFKKGGYGTRDTERAAWITKSGDNYNLVAWPWSAANKQESWPKGKPLPDGTIGIAHTHPNRNPKPSTSGGGTGEGDFGASKQIRAPIYAITRDAIWKQNSMNGKSVQTQVAGRDWWKPYEKEKCND